jgi:hypothetical protein
MCFLPKEKQKRKRGKLSFVCVTHEMFDDDDNERREIKWFKRHCFFLKRDLPPLVRPESGAVVAARQARTTLVDLLHQNPLEKRERRR